MMKNMALAGNGMKKLILAVLLLCLVIGQIQVEAKSCCPSTTARNIYNTCRFGGASRSMCAKLSGCKIISGNKCKPPNDHLTLDPDTEEVNVLNFCKLGCASSVCNNINAALGNEEANDAVESCDQACSSFCSVHVGSATVVA
ncbi:hypothetical protein SEVIR_6G097657v4 [Setaria viridis]|uniref:Uncharacterized protein n=1 Tax=Setaria viridis TaxID=4556 RepID=A0A4U6U9G0_SETVI|nr:thionin-like [Setaria viridis]XP_034601666.1 thionin-like [Setaria viridis]TKW10099.1 hypothetical protein SEVIR_6G097657v2 [Setaria viridis]